LREELTEILKDYLTLTSEQYRGQLAQAQIQIYRQLLGGMGAIFRVYLSMILPSERKRMLAAMRLALEKVKVKISNLRDAQDGFERFIANNTDLVIKDVFGPKIRQLVEVNRKKEARREDTWQE